MVFISYSSYDVAHALRLVDAFHHFGKFVWIDQYYLKLGEPIEPQLEMAIRKSAIFCLVDSAKARKSGWVQYEIDMQTKVDNRLVIYPLIDMLQLCAIQFVEKIMCRYDPLSMVYCPSTLPNRRCTI